MVSVVRPDSGEFGDEAGAAETAVAGADGAVVVRDDGPDGG